MPNILMEVAAAGLPIVASNIGGIKEFVKHDQTGLLVDMEDVDGYIDSVNRLVSNPEKAKQLAANSQKLLKEQHSWDNFTSKVKRDIL